MKKVYDGYTVEVLTEILPDPTVNLSDMHKYGYTALNMLPATFNIAMALAEEGYNVYRLFPDNDEGRVNVDCEEENIEHGFNYGMFGIDRDDWHDILKSHSLFEINDMYWSRARDADIEDVPIDFIINILPDPTIDSEEMRDKGILFADYLPVREELAKELMDNGQMEVYALNNKDGYFMEEYDPEDPVLHNDDGIYCVDREEWYQYLSTHTHRLAGSYREFWRLSDW